MNSDRHLAIRVLLAITIITLGYGPNQVISLLTSSKQVPKLFNDTVLPPERRDGEWIPHLGHIHKLDTCLGGLLATDSFTTKFTIFNRHQVAPVDLMFDPKPFCLPESCFGSYQYDLLKMAASAFDPKLRTLIFISGYLTGDQVTWMDQAKDLWLELEDVNVILVTWRSANRYIYSRAVAHTPLVSRQVTIFLYYLAELFGYMPTDPEFAGKIHFVGHSLGAHIAGFVGKDLGGQMGRVTGLDPAGPSFDRMSRRHRLDSSDARLVDAIHTNSGQIHYVNALASGVIQAADLLLESTPILGGLTRKLTDDYTGEGDTAWFGIDVQVGHVDYYANGGSVQPGCPGLLHICDHGRSHRIYLEIMRYELELRRYTRDVADSLQLSEILLKESRLLAFKSRTYESFLTGESFNRNCPNLLSERRVSGGGNESHLDETFRQCSLPIDLVTPAGQLRDELESVYKIQFDPHALKYPTYKRYYFKTHQRDPFVGDHNILKVYLDHSSTWDSSCALRADIKMAGGLSTSLELNKQVKFVKGANGDFYGLAMAFTNPIGSSARLGLLNMLNQTVIDEEKVERSVTRVLPLEVSLIISGANSTSLVETLKTRIWNLGFKRRASDRCRLDITSVEVEPIVAYRRSVIGLYGSQGTKQERIPILGPKEHASLMRTVQVVSPTESPRVTRTLDALVLG